ncbi:MULTISPECIES: AraC family transcriptional regulator [unclassified Mesorhizobium]|uniref:helix-turn-helix domain-containing protein n=1 Tax=unclassified Mesorhizobium TaxID=325217 RepID=UPI000FC9D7A8|nr:MULTISPECIES: AraC family transcriptional regulator [unclassified Mesorhizobium]RUW51175.1 AraC family transcriptional regulator [Mesorhizobium sp. M8A.F.Ca.ET.021.01.1.1]TGP88965.1 AraC family transcriptional regulator [Mesorhizobium sp. M8A.F.Ca.ET.218.01.1.1]TGS47994.1 AraC family transcriptional regulator [Mesorhizobium sp. M8A.F.Ca.ET.182.01.1.1]TGS83716.1 AraC family transcriptional regulator [Mesorhizobium sp. M8A.F.Ca.ET.181.01.1.1]TGT16126.1 AraC family transcriptional regulator [M
MPIEMQRPKEQDRSISGLFEMRRRLPNAALDGVVTDICGYRETATGHFRNVEYASLTVPLVISFAEPFAIGLGRTPDDNDRVASFAAGLFAGPVMIESFGGACCIQVNFTPLGARRFFRLPMSELTDNMVVLDDVLGAEGAALRERLGNTPDWTARFDLAEAFVAARLESAAETPLEIAWAYDRIITSGGRTRIASLAEQLGWSRKHLADKFSDATGIGPKTLSRIVRFNRALRLSSEPTADWADVAADCGYADQAHLVREFRELAGETPTALSVR